MFPIYLLRLTCFQMIGRLLILIWARKQTKYNKRFMDVLNVRFWKLEIV